MSHDLAGDQDEVSSSIGSSVEPARELNPLSTNRERLDIRVRPEPVWRGIRFGGRDSAD